MKKQTVTCFILSSVVVLTSLSAQAAPLGTKRDMKPQIVSSIPMVVGQCGEIEQMPDSIEGRREASRFAVTLCETIKVGQEEVIGTTGKGLLKRDVYAPVAGSEKEQYRIVTTMNGAYIHPESIHRALTDLRAKCEEKRATVALEIEQKKNEVKCKVQ